MIDQPTCLILGAGASVPYGFPSGATLKWRIIDEVAKRGTKAYLALTGLGHTETSLRAFVDAFAGSKQNSIDAFLAQNDTFGLIGKRAIAAVLIACENPARLRRPEGDAPDDWISHVWAALQDGGQERFTDNRLSIVSFNYDRSVERALRDAYWHSFGVSMIEEATEAITATIPIVKVHGSLGGLVDRPTDHSRMYLPEVEPHHVHDAAEGIVVLHEGQDTSPEFERARELITRAERVVLLGCGFHQENMSRLDLKTGQGGLRVGTGYELTERERRLAKTRHGIEVGDRAWKSVRFLRERLEL